MELLRAYIESEIDELDAQGVRLRLIGDWRALSHDVVCRLDAALERTAGNAGMSLVIALNYGAQDELARAAAAAAAAGPVTAASIEAHLDTAGLPPLDLVVRTSGEYPAFQLPAVAGGLCGAVLHRRIVARLRRRGASRGVRQLRAARPPFGGL
jgi:undecaprenyl diphosphate synthase